MKSKTLSVIAAIVVLVSMLLAACQPAATPAPAAEAPAAEEPTAAPAAEEPTAALAAEEPTAAPAAEEAVGAPYAPMTVTNSSCGPADIIKEMTTVDQYTVKFTLCKPDPAFLAKASFEPFSVQPKEFIEKTGGKGEILEAPVGTGPYKIDKWNRGDSVSMTAFDQYWGPKALTPKAVIRWATESAARVLELQSGTAHITPNIDAAGFDSVKNDATLKFLPIENPNILYLGMVNTKKPYDNPKVRQAIAMGLDRQRIVDNFMPEGSEVASHFTPCTVPHGCDGEEWYAFDATAAKALLAEAGFPNGFDTKIYYRDVVRTYLPKAGDVAVEIQTQLKENLGINAEVVVMESGEFISEANEGKLDGLYLLGWGADYMHITNFLDYHFAKANVQFGEPFEDIYGALEKAAELADPGDLYKQANDAIKTNVPMVPISHAAAAGASVADMNNPYMPPFGQVNMGEMSPASGDTLVMVQNAEPISLYPMDETDGESLSASRQILEGLYMYDSKGESQPALAESFTANTDATEYVFKLRQGVKFHDGSDLDAADVVASWAAGLDAKSPFHTGNTGTFEYPSNLFGLMNDDK